MVLALGAALIAPARTSCAEGRDPFAIPATDDGLPGAGPLRRYDWFQRLWKERRSEWARRVEQDRGAVVFLGDSITQGWGGGLGAAFPGVKVANRGIGGDTSRGVLLRLAEDVLVLDPAAVVLLIGTNDLEEGAAPEVVAGNLKLIVAALERHDSQMPIVLCQVFPSSATQKRPPDRIRALNALYLAAVKNDPRVTYLETWPLFADPGGDAIADEFPDLLHPNEAGYAKWAAALRPILATLGLTETGADAFTPEDGFESLFNGRDLTGWGYRPTSDADKASAARWQATDPHAAAWPFVSEPSDFDGLGATPDGRFAALHGRLVVTTPPEYRKIQQLWTKREFRGDFVLKLEFRATPNADSGVYLRGPQLQVRDYRLAGPYKGLRSYKPQDWNELVVTVRGDVARATCNGEPLEGELALPASGPIGVEGDRGQMEYRRIRIRTLAGGDWARFRGPNGIGVQDSGALPAELGATRNVVWKVALPPGYSSPVVSGDRIFVTAAEGEKLLTIALDPATGREQWRRESPRERREKLDKRNGPASPTPVADGQNVYVFFPDYGLLSYTFAGEERWRTPLGPFTNVYGMGSSPILAGDKVVLVCDQSRGSFAAAFRQSDGREVWRTPRPEALSGHSTPIVYDPPGGPLQVIAPGSFRLDSYAAATGETVSWINGLPGEMKSGPVLAGDTIYVNGFSTPDNDPGRQVPVAPFAEVLARQDADHDGRISPAEAPDERTRRYFPFIDLDEDGAADAREWRIWAIGSASENGLLAFRAGGQGDRTGDSLRWRYARSVPQLPTTLVYRGVVYMINDGGVLTTLDAATGQVRKQARLRGAVDHYYASPVAGDGKVYIVSQAGVAVVLDAARDQEILSTGELDDEVYATPAIAGGRIFVRTRSALYCFGS
jgi:lysophospholipase L1-like esterase/outer membrane protein assembly factor BamB